MFKYLKTFRMVYETRNFSKAAERLYISQPAVSTQIKQLEEELNVLLFVRNGKQEMRATTQAEMLYQYLLKLTDDWEAVLTALHQEESKKETCVIVASNTFAVYYLPELMRKLYQNFPTIEFILEMNNSEQVLDKVEKHDAHFGFIEKPLITNKVLRQEIASDELVHAGDFSQEVWLVREADSGVFHYTQQYFTEKNLIPSQLVIKNNDMIIKCLEQGLGQSIVSKKALSPSLCWRELPKKYQRKLYFLKRAHLTSQQLVAVATFITDYYSKR